MIYTRQRFSHDQIKVNMGGSCCMYDGEDQRFLLGNTKERDNLEGRRRRQEKDIKTDLNKSVMRQHGQDSSGVGWGRHPCETW